VAAHAAQHSVSTSQEVDVGSRDPLVTCWITERGFDRVPRLHGSTSADQRCLVGTGEIGVPPYFAMRLSFPERVTPHNVEQLRQASRGPVALALLDPHERLVTCGGTGTREALVLHF